MNKSNCDSTTGIKFKVHCVPKGVGSVQLNEKRV